MKINTTTTVFEGIFAGAIALFLGYILDFFIGSFWSNYLFAVWWPCIILAAVFSFILFKQNQINIATKLAHFLLFVVLMVITMYGLWWGMLSYIQHHASDDPACNSAKTGINCST